MRALQQERPRAIELNFLSLRSVTLPGWNRTQPKSFSGPSGSPTSPRESGWRRRPQLATAESRQAPSMSQTLQKSAPKKVRLDRDIAISPIIVVHPSEQRAIQEAIGRRRIVLSNRPMATDSDHWRQHDGQVGAYRRLSFALMQRRSVWGLRLSKAEAQKNKAPSASLQ